MTELIEVIALAEAGRIRATVERYPFAEVEKAFAALHEGRVHGRAVVVP